jgi:hypothetical protein
VGWLARRGGGERGRRPKKGLPPARGSGGGWMAKVFLQSIDKSDGQPSGPNQSPSQTGKVQCIGGAVCGPRRSNARRLGLRGLGPGRRGRRKKNAAAAAAALAKGRGGVV